MMQFKCEWKDRFDEIGTSIIMETHEEGIHEVMQEFRRFLLGVGFHSDNIDAYIEAD